MSAERGIVAAWVASWTDRERTEALAGLEEKTRALRETLGAETGAGEAELLAGAVFLEYAERTGVCPLELHWILGDAAAASMEAVLSVRVQMMVEDAVKARAGERQTGVPRVAGLGRPCSGRAYEGRRSGREVARSGEAPNRNTPERSPRMLD